MNRDPGDVEQLTNSTISPDPLINEHYNTPNEVGFCLDCGLGMAAM
jgi:hypothetical protein